MEPQAVTATMTDTYHLPVRVICSIVPVDVQSHSLNTASFKHCKHWDHHANDHADTQWWADTMPVQQRINDTIQQRQQQEDEHNVEQRQPSCWHLHTTRQRFTSDTETDVSMIQTK